MSTRRVETLVEPRPAGRPRARPIVCVVDADAGLRERVRALLGTLGVEVRGYERASTLLDALDVEDVAPTALVADVVLPDLGGLQLLAELRRRGMKVPTILLSAEADVSSAVGAMRAGALDFIEKPYVERALLNQVASLLRDDDGHD
jgi:FixJ family two-component response regulator